METKNTCIVCKKSQMETPLTKFNFKDSHFHICPQHIPLLIHDPQKLAGLLPDAENMEGA